MSFHRRIILAVDDDPEMLEIYQELLASDHIDVHTAHDGLEGLNKIKKFRYDAIISDLNMPQLDGIQFISCIKTNALNSQTPVFVVSSEIMNEKYSQLQQLGVIRGLKKPLNYDLLEKSVKDAIKINHKHPICYHPKIITQIEECSQEICQFYFGKEANCSEPLIHRGDDPHGVATGCINLFGKQLFGMVSVSLDVNMIVAFAERLFGTAALNNESLDFADLVGEITSQLGFNLQKKMAEEGISVVVGLPFVLKGEEHKIPACIASPKVGFNMKLDDGSFQVEFSLGDPQLLDTLDDEKDAEIFIYEKDKAA